MRFDWIPASAALLVTGATAFALGTLIMPSPGSEAETIRLVQQEDARWLAVALISFLASVMLTLGLPAALTLVSPRHSYLGMASALVLSAGFIGIAGYSMLLAAFRALVVTGAITPEDLDRAASEGGFRVLLLLWISSFVLGEVLLAIALLLSRGVARVLPALLLAHAVLTLLLDLMPEAAGKAVILLFAASFSGIGIVAAAPDRLTRSVS